MGQTQQLLQSPSGGENPVLGVHSDTGALVTGFGVGAGVVLLVAFSVGALVALAAPGAPLKDSTTTLLVLLRPVNANAAEESPLTTPRKTIAAMKRRIIMLRLLLLKRLQV